MATLSLTNLTLPGYLKDLTLEVADREFLVLAGPFGCGATAALRAIAGLDPIASGEIALAGKRINDLAPKDRDVAMVFQDDALYPLMSVRENMAFPLKLRKFPNPEIKRRIAETAAILEIEPLLSRKPPTLSRGERQRVSLARAIVRQPKVFLFDEPLLDLDPATRPPMRTEILRLHQRIQATIIYATHDPVEAMTMGERLVILRDGLLQQTGAPLHIYRQPANLFVAAFLGAPPINLVHGKLRESGDTLSFKESNDGVIELKLPDSPGLKPFAGREVIAGIRPEDIHIVTAPAKPGAPRFRALLDVVELMGAETQAHIETGAHTLISRTASTIGSEESGHRVQFEIDPASIHLFDPETTLRITP